MRRVVSVSEMRHAEQAVGQVGVSERQLMQNAGTAAAQVIADQLHVGADAVRALVLCGPGNNGGDGVVVAEQLSEWGLDAHIYTFYRQNSPLPRVPTTKHEDDRDLAQLRHLVEDCTVVIDALLGTGRSRGIEGDLARILDTVRETTLQRPVVALDLPSGVDADSGTADSHTLPATVTITFGYLKRGLLVGDGQVLAGQIIPVDIGLPEDDTSSIGLWHIEQTDIQSRIPARSHNVNKYSAGAVLVVAGSRQFTGAPQLSALGAARVGAGLITIATGASTHPILATSLREPTFLILQDDEHGVLEAVTATSMIRDAASRYKALLIGPGLAQAQATIDLVDSLLCEPGLPEGMPIIVDAEGLNALSKIARWAERKRYPLVLTPHSGEMARLCRKTSAQVEEQRFDIALEQARLWNAVVVLKGNPTVTASPDGIAIVNSTGGPNLASAGTGDVLSGIISGLIAQSAEPFAAAVAGVYLHGYTGDMLAMEHGDRGTLAGDLLPVIPGAIQEVLYGKRDALLAYE